MKKKNESVEIYVCVKLREKKSLHKTGSNACFKKKRVEHIPREKKPVEILRRTTTAYRSDKYVKASNPNK